jgi:hypothetical protein
MRSYEIPNDQWVEFFNRFSKEHVNWPVSLELLSKESGPQRLSGELPLQGISFDPGGTRPATIRVEAGDSASASFSHAVDLPLHIRLAEQEDGSDGAIEIEPARGAPTLVHFHRPA